MKVSNPNTSRSIVANVEGDWYEIRAGRSIETDDVRVATGLAQYGAHVDPLELVRATEAMASANRAQNAKHASASAAEGEILERQQATSDLTGTGRGDRAKPDKLLDTYDGSVEPGWATVDAVRAYLDATDDEAERARVIGLEAARDDKARDGIVGWAPAETPPHTPPTPPSGS